jgi:hypothetical protein
MSHMEPRRSRFSSRHVPLVGGAQDAIFECGRSRGDVRAGSEMAMIVMVCGCSGPGNVPSSELAGPRMILGVVLVEAFP